MYTSVTRERLGQSTAAKEVGFVTGDSIEAVTCEDEIFSELLLFLM